MLLNIITKSLNNTKHKYALHLFVNFTSIRQKKWPIIIFFPQVCCVCVCVCKIAGKGL